MDLTILLAEFAFRWGVVAALAMILAIAWRLHGRLDALEGRPDDANEADWWKRGAEGED